MTHRLFTVRVSVSDLHIAGTDATMRVYEAEFAGRSFSRTDESALQYWVRVAARNVYGKQTQVIFIHEGTEQ